MISFGFKSYEQDGISQGNFEGILPTVYKEPVQLRRRTIN